MELRLSRVARILSVIVVALLALSAAPLMLAVSANEASVASSAAATTEVRVGWVSDVVMWNPMNIEMVEDFVACYLIFSCLFTYDIDYSNPVGDLATGYTQVVNPNGSMTTTITMTSNAYFRNRDNPTDTSHPVTAEDVNYTYRRIMENPGGMWDTYLYNITYIRAVDDTTLEILTEFEKAMLISDLAGIPIIPKYMWTTIADNKFLSAKTPDWLVGSGPFYFDDQLQGAWIRFTKAPNYHGEIDYPGERDVDIGSILYTIYGTPDAMTLAINAGTEDVICLSGNTNLYLNSLGGGNPYIVKLAIQEPGICDIAINAIPMDIRDYYGPPYCTGNELLLDYWVREAIVMTQNKTYIDDVLMNGLVEPADSVVEPSWWHLDIEPEVQYNPAAAKAMLEDHGYADTDTDGYLEATASAYPVVMGWANVNDELNFRVQAPNNEPSYMSIGENWVAPAAEAGIRFEYSAESENVMINQAWYQADYDIWVWHWGWGGDPLGSALSCWLTEEIAPGGDNCQMPMGPWYYTQANSTTGVAYSAYDENYTLALKTVDPAERLPIVQRLQQWIYDSRCEIPPFYDLGLYGYSEARFTNWGDWVAHKGLSTQSTLPWLWWMIEPAGNVKPVFYTPLPADTTIFIDDTATLQVEVGDYNNDSLTLNWTFGDGSPVVVDTIPGGATSIPQLVTQTHQYAAVGDYTVTVELWDGVAGHERTSTGVVHVSSIPDGPPTIENPPEYSPAPPQYTGATVDWWVNVSDDNAVNRDLRFTWVWGDGQVTVSNVDNPTPGATVTDHQTHVWTAAGAYSVTVYVWDGVVDPTHNQSSFTPYTIIADQPPTKPVISQPISGLEDTWIPCTATGTDDDPYDLRFTWVWDDGTFNVTNHVNSAPTTDVTSTQSHMWATPGTYSVTVWLDDLTGLAGHNVSSDVATVNVLAVGTNLPPSSPLVAITPAAGERFAGVDLTFNLSATDGDGDAMTVYVEYGDGSAEVMTTAGGVTTRQYVESVKAYSAAGTYLVNVTFDDGQASGNISAAQTTVVILTPPENQPPWLDIQTNYGATYAVELTITPLRALDNDSDILEVWYDWGDDTNWTLGDDAADYSASHTYMATGDFTLTVWADDTTGGHNISKTAVVNVDDNAWPSFVGTVTKNPLKAEYNETETITFTVVVKDFEGDELIVAIEFGDGELDFETFVPSPNTNATTNFTHVYGTGSGRIDPYQVNVTVIDDQEHYAGLPPLVTTTVKVAVPEVEPPPEDGDDEEALPWALIAGIAILAIIVIAAVLLLMMKRKKGGAEKAEGMEGMSPPEGAPPPPPQ